MEYSIPGMNELLRVRRRQLLGANPTIQGCNIGNPEADDRTYFNLVAEGRSSKEIAEVLFISVRAVESHRANIVAKLHLTSTADMVRYALREGHVEEEPVKSGSAPGPTDQ